MKEKRGWFMKKFTLVELLVVIAVIAILAGLLLPALGKARATARTIACAGIIKQFGTAAALYTDAFDGYYVPFRMSETATGLNNTWYSNRIFMDYLKIFPGQYWTNQLNGPMRYPLGMICPDALWARTGAPAKELELSPGDKGWLNVGVPKRAYGMNMEPCVTEGYFDGPSTNIWGEGTFAYHTPKLKSPSKKLIIADALNVGVSKWASVNPYGNQGYFYQGADSKEPVTGTPIAWRHPGGTANILFFDGHIERGSWPRFQPGSALNEYWLPYN